MRQFYYKAFVVERGRGENAEKCGVYASRKQAQAHLDRFPAYSGLSIYETDSMTADELCHLLEDDLTPSELEDYRLEVRHECR